MQLTYILNQYNPCMLLIKHVPPTIPSINFNQVFIYIIKLLKSESYLCEYLLISKKNVLL